MIKSLVFFIVFFLLASFPSQTLASSYVLPYPGVMPGNKLYHIYEFTDNLKKYIAFGDFAQFSYNLSQADKYLVEAKVLFEYDQYLLALRALQKSDGYIVLAKESLHSAQKNNKDTSEKKRLYTLALVRHNEVLSSLLTILPQEFTWRDEKKLPVNLKIYENINRAIEMRSSL